MKFWQKIFFGTFIIFVVVFDASAFILTSFSYDFNRQREIDSGIREQNVILSSAASGISNAEKFYPDVSQNKERLIAIMKPLADYYQQQEVFLALFEGDNDIYSNISDIDKTLLNFETPQSKNVTDRVVDKKRYVFVASQISGYPHLTLVYVRDITQIDDFRMNVSRVFIILSAIVFTVLGISIFLLLKHMTLPITKLNEITAEIANGSYDKRVSVKRSDELGTLGRNFNRMADSVEENVARLTKAAEDKQQFIDDFTHEMKTPLTSILGYSEYLQNAKGGENERIIAAGHLHNAALRLKSLSGKMMELTFLRGEKIKFQQIYITDLFKTLNEMTHQTITSRSLNLTMLADIGGIKGDETLLLSLLANLVENAARASKPNETITVKAYGKDYPIIEVSDTGHGMEKYEIEKITSPFYRVDKSRSREFGGVGLGLSIVSQIAELHGARLEIESEPGLGSTVRIHFTTI